MTDDELERRLRAWYRAEIAEREPAPEALHVGLGTIPETTSTTGARTRPGRGFVLLAAATLLLTLLIGATIAIGSGLIPAPWAVDEEPPVLVDEQPAPSSSAIPSAPPFTRFCPDVEEFAARMGTVSGSGWPDLATSPGPTAEAPPGALTGWEIGAPDVVLLDPQTGAETPLLERIPLSPSGIAWSPNGHALAITWCDLFVMVGDEFYRPSPGLETTGILKWSPDSSRLAVHSLGTAEDSLLVVRQDGGPVVDLGSPCEGCRIQSPPLWSPDGSRLAVHYFLDVGLGGWGVAFADPDGGAWRAQPLAPMTLEMVTGWLDNDHLVALVWESGAISDADPPAWVSISADSVDDIQPLDLDGDPAADVWARHESATTRGLLFAPDRSSIAFVTRDGDGGPLAPYQVTIADLASGDDRVVWTGDPSEGAWPEWSADSSAVAITTFTYSADTQGVWIVNADGSELRRIRDEPFQLMSWQAPDPAATER